jgi:hypothetical protein
MKALDNGTVVQPAVAGVPGLIAVPTLFASPAGPPAP